MKAVVEYFSNKEVLFKSFKKIDRTTLKTRKKVVIFVATDIKGNYHLVFKTEQKGRFLVKNAIGLIELEEKLRQLQKHNFKYKHLIIGGAICSKSISYLNKRGWQLHYALM